MYDTDEFPVQILKLGFDQVIKCLFLIDGYIVSMVKKLKVCTGAFNG